MIVMRCRNRVEVYAKWKAVFDSHTQAHRAAGPRLRDFRRDLEDPNNVFCTFEVAGIDDARAFINDPASAEAGRASGVPDREVHFLESSPDE